MKRTIGWHRYRSRTDFVAEKDFRFVLMGDNGEVDNVFEQRNTYDIDSWDHDKYS